MSIKNTILIIVLAVWCMNVVFHCGGGSSEPLPLEDDIPIPYHKQEYCNFCGVACVQMWSHADFGFAPNQIDLASAMGVEPHGLGAAPSDMVKVVGNQTASEGYLALVESTETGAQGDLISSTIEGVKYCTPSIMPFDFAEHAVLIKGYQWREKEDGTPFAIKCYFHDPDNQPNQRISAADLRYRFDPTPSYYWVILGQYDFLIDGTLGHDSFVMQFGTYYGGPAEYNPKGLDTGFPTH